MVKILITKDLIEWLCREFPWWTDEMAKEFAREFVGVLQTSGGLTPAAPDALPCAECQEDGFCDSRPYSDECLEKAKRG